MNSSSPRLSGLRVCPVAGFENYLVFHIPAPGSIEIVRVLHGAQDVARMLDEQSFYE